MEFFITVKSGYRNYRLKVQHILVDDRYEHFKVIARNKTLLLQSNRPFFRKRGLKHRRPDWKLLDGEIFHGAVYEQILEQIMKVIDAQ